MAIVPKLLFDIAKYCNFCHLISQNQTPHPCDVIIDFQREQVKSKSACDFQLPEPWNGDIVNAPILVISSNPAYSCDELYPTLNWPDKMIADFFINRFKNRGTYSWVLNNRPLQKNGTRGRAVRYWSSIQKIIGTILGRPAIPGVDYCLTELVHCKSSSEKGVKKALPVCAGNYCQELLKISGAKLIIVVGSIARNYILKYCSLPNGIPTIYLRHPSSWGNREIFNLPSEDEIKKLRKLIEEERKENEKPIGENNKNQNCSCDVEYVDINLPTDEEVEEFIKGKIEEYKKGLINLGK